MNTNQKLSMDINQNIKLLNEILPIKRSFDVIGREIIIGQSTRAYLVFIDGFAKDDIMLWIIDILQALPETDLSNKVIETLLKKRIGYIEVERFTDIEQMRSMVLAGAVGFIVDGQNEGLIIDAREYPVRSPEEPELEKVSRGSRDGLVETVIFRQPLLGEDFEIPT